MDLLTLVIGIISAGTVIFYWEFVAGRKIFFTASNYFFFLQVLFLIGTFLAMDPSAALDQEWLSIMAGGMFLFTCGAVLANHTKGFNPRVEIARFVARPLVDDVSSNAIYYIMLFIGLISVIVGLRIVLAIGFNLFFQSLFGALQGTTIDHTTYSELRNGVSHGKNGYIGIGYLYQFTATLLPIIIFMFYFRIRQKKQLLDRFIFYTFIVADVYFTTVVGSRYRLMTVFIVAIFLFSPYGPVPALWKSIKTNVIVLLCTGILFYALSTTFAGRAHFTLGEQANDLYNRVMGDYMKEELTVMRELLQKPPLMGAEWSNTLLSILPVAQKKENIGFDNYIYSLAFKGDTSGSMSLLAWGSMIYNWGIVGTIFCSFILGYFMQIFSIFYIRCDRLVSSVLILFFAEYCLSQYFDPYSIVLDGFTTSMLFYMIIRTVHRYLLQSRYSTPTYVPRRILRRIPQKTTST